MGHMADTRVFKKICYLSFRPADSTKEAFDMRGNVSITEFNFIFSDFSRNSAIIIPMSRIEGETFRDPLFGKERFEWRVASGSCQNAEPLAGKFSLLCSSSLAVIVEDIAERLLALRSLLVNPRRVALMDQVSGRILLFSDETMRSSRCFTQSELNKCRHLLRSMSERRRAHELLSQQKILC
uniref:Uncharacterized protein n=1 Tax=Cyanoptyche gloeocystis TaxID=77922 RepID=A0A7S2JKZ5_9EUKA